MIDDNEQIAIGLLADPFITSGPWVVHPYWDSLPPGSGVPIHDTPCKPVPVQKVATRPAHGPTHSSVGANNLAAIIVPVVMLAVVLSMTFLGLATVLDGHPQRSVIVVACVAGAVLFGVVLSAPGLLTRRRIEDRSGSDVGEGLDNFRTETIE